MYIEMGTRTITSEDFEKYLKDAEAGDSEAQIRVGICYQYGKGVEENLWKAIKWYIRAAEQDNNSELTGYCFLRNICLEETELSYKQEQIDKCLLEEAEQGYVVAQEMLGECHAFGIHGNLTEAEKWYTKAAEQGNATAMFRLGCLYRLYKKTEGREFAKHLENYVEAAKWFRKAAEAGLAEGSFWLGFCYNYGEGVDQDYEEAVKWYTKAIEDESVNAIYHMAECYRNGWGVPKDEKKAEDLHDSAMAREDEMDELFRSYHYEESADGIYKVEVDNQSYCYNGSGVKAWENSILMKAEQGDAEAQYQIGKWYTDLSLISKKNEEENAVKWYLRAAEQSHTNAERCLGDCYYVGRGVAKDYEEAVIWYRKAAEKGDVEAIYNIGKCYFEGKGVKQSCEDAISWYLKGDDQGDSMCQVEIGNCYYIGNGVKQNYEEAVKWYLKALKPDCPFPPKCKIRYRLADCYRLGIGVKKDLVKAEEWQKSAKEAEGWDYEDWD